MKKSLIEHAAICIRNSDAILFTAGAGIGADSGLPTFRGNEGLWKEYPFFKKAKMSFVDAANPQFFQDNPHKFWFFYGHRYNVYKEKSPHAGFRAMLDMGQNMPNQNYFVYTSNVDNHFTKAGFDQEKIVECHGSIMHFQCTNCWEIFEASVDRFDLDKKHFEVEKIPKCKTCQNPVRPNILLFGDYDWISDRTEQ